MLSKEEKEEIYRIPFMGRTNEQILSIMNFTEISKRFLDKCQPGMGNLLINTRKNSPQDPDFIGYGKTDEGTPIRLEGVGKTSEKGHKMMSFKIITIPGNIYSNTTFEAKVPNYRPNSEFLEG